MVSISRIVANYSTTLSSKTTIGGTTSSLLSNLDKDGTPLSTGFYCFLIDKNATTEEHITCTNTAGVLTNVKHLSRQGVETVGFNFVHQIGATVIITDFANIKTLSDNAGGGGTIDNILTYTTNLTAADATFQIPHWTQVKTYADGLSFAGAPDSSTITKGIGRVSVAPVAPAIPIFVGDNDGRVPTQDENDALVGTFGTPATANPFVTGTDVVLAVTASRIPRRDATGNLQSVSTLAATDVAIKSYVDTTVEAKYSSILIPAFTASLTSLNTTTQFTIPIPALSANSFIKGTIPVTPSGNASASLNGTLTYGGATIGTFDLTFGSVTGNLVQSGSLTFFIRNDNSTAVQNNGLALQIGGGGNSTGNGFPAFGTTQGSFSSTVVSSSAQNLVLSTTTTVATGGSMIFQNGIIEIFNKA